MVFGHTIRKAIEVVFLFSALVFMIPSYVGLIPFNSDSTVAKLLYAVLSIPLLGMLFSGALPQWQEKWE